MEVDTNRRLAHRRCNSARGNQVPELAWPGGVATIDAVGLFDALSRLPAGAPPVIVALLIDATEAAWARGFVVERASLVFGGCWEAEVRRERSWFSVLVRRVPDASERSAA